MSLIGYLIIGFAVTAVAGNVASGLIRSDDVAFPCFVAGMSAAIIGAVLLLVWIGAGIGYRVGSNECERFGVETQLDTKMVRYNTVGWDCLVRSDSGWVAKDNYWNSEVRP